MPRFPEAAASWLQGLRSKYDPKYARLVAPHVTLVFPTDLLPEARFVAHVVSCSRGAKGGRVEFSAARVFADGDAGTHLVYLLPGSGAELFVRLHEELYSGPLGPLSRAGVEYVPHITLGRFACADAAAAVTAEIDGASRPIAGEVDSVDIVHVGEDLVRHVHTEPLRAA